MVEDKSILVKTDFLVAISSSGKSPNILNAISHANDCIGYVLAIFGMDGETPFTGNRYENNYIHIDSHNYGVIELTSEIILHGIVEGFGDRMSERILKGVIT